jgi:alpha-aminoadipic semialdehyde synthase
VLIGIRREDKNRWERRVPLTPADVSDLQRQGLRFRVQPSANRIFSDSDYQAQGTEVAEDLDPCDLVLAVKEIPTELLRAGKTYVYFSHVIKGQDYNMPMLRRLLELGCSLVDYERIVDDRGRRLIFFSLHAGHAGMIDSLWTLGQRLAAAGLQTPLAEIRQTFAYPSFAAAKEHLREVGERLPAAWPAALRPLTIGIAGYGNVARGCREVLDCLPCEWIDPADLPRLGARDAAAPPLRCVELREEHLVRPAAGQPFDLQEYYDHPERYAGQMEAHLPHLDLLMNTIYWTERYPRLITRQWVAEQYGGDRQPRLQVIGDISCDIDGAVQITRLATMPDAPSYVVDPATGEITMGVEGPGPAVMAVDNLPCEVSRESSEHFSAALRGLVPHLARADWQAAFADLDLPPSLKTAVIVHRGELTPDYRYLEEYLGA